jgi:hypothetical protein
MHALGYYRFYLQRDGHTFAAEILECDGDSDALVKAKELLASTTTFRLMEVWQGTARLALWRRVLTKAMHRRAQPRINS